MITLKIVKQRLLHWGQFWANQEKGQGFASQSVTSRCCDILRTGIESSGTTHMFNQSADSIFVPYHHDEVGQCVAKLSINEQHWLKQKYIKKRKVDNLFIDRAEAALVGLME